MLLREELFSSAGLLLGRVFAGTCDTTVDAGEGVAGVRVYLEDGRYAVTDDEGKYHFEGVTPGSHVVQLDTITLPEELEPLRCDTRVRSAGNATSQFVDLRGGALGTADFVVSERAAPTGAAPLSSSHRRRPRSAAARARVGALASAHGARAGDRRGDARAARGLPAAERRLRAAGADGARRASRTCPGKRFGSPSTAGPSAL